MTLSFGQHLIKGYLPPGTRLDRGPLNKRRLRSAFLDMAKNDPTAYVHNMQGLKAVADEVATLEPLSPGLDDITPNYVKQRALFAGAQKRLDAARTYPQKLSVLADAQSRAVNLAMTHPGSLAREVEAGARGSPSQLIKTVVSPVVAMKHDKTVYPYLIHHSFAEGLSPAEAWLANSEARLNAMAANLSVSEPGDLSKIFINNMADQVIASEDCGTTNGIALPSNSPELRDRYLAKPAAGLPHNTLVTAEVGKRLARTRGLVVVRSPSTCELPNGICQRCMGLNEVGQNHDIGINVGVRAGQVLSEPLTQMALDSKHGVKLSTTKGRELRTIERLRQIVEVPASMANMAVVAEEEGKVEKIEKAPQGGHYMHVAGQRYYTPPEAPPLVRPGFHVEAGDALADGIPNPKDVTRLKGIGAGRDYLIQRLDDLYSSSGHDLDRRHLEILAKTHLNYAQIWDPGSIPGLRAGDMVAHSALRGRLREASKERSLKETKGHVLGDDYLHFTAGSPITKSVQDALREAKISKVKTLPPGEAPRLEFVMKPLSRNPLLNPDVLSRMGHRYLKTALLEGVHSGGTARLRGFNPIPALAYGQSFGLPSARGKY